MPIPEASCHAETGKGSTWTNVCLHFVSSEWHQKRQTCHLLSSPTQFPWLRQLWGLRRKSSVTSTEAPDFSSSSTTTSTWPSSAARCRGVRPRGGGHEARPTGSMRERKRVGKTRKLRKLRVPKIVSPGRANIAHHLTKECQEKRKGGGSVRGEGAGLKHNARCGLVAGMEVIGQVFLPRETYTVHYTVKRKVCAGLKPIWLVQVWRQRDLESIVLDLRVRTCPPISAFTQDWNPPTLFFNITSSGPYPWSILTDQSSFIVLLLCGQRWYSESKRSEPANLLWHFHQKN